VTLQGEALPPRESKGRTAVAGHVRNWRHASGPPSSSEEVLRSAQAASADVRPGVSCLSALRTYRACVGKARPARPDGEQP
jgi:hypothetical protein